VVAPLEPLTHLMVGETYHHLGDHVTARAAYQETLRLDPESADAMRGLAALDLDAGHGGQALRGFLGAAALRPATGSQASADIAAVLWRVTWYLRLVLLVSATVVAGSAADGDPWIPTTPTRLLAAAALMVAAVILWRIGRGLPPRGVRAVTAALRRGLLLPIAVGLLVAGLAVLLAIVITGYPGLGVVLYILVVVQFAVTITAELRVRRTLRRSAATPP
jgi:hypothetical protein